MIILGVNTMSDNTYFLYMYISGKYIISYDMTLVLSLSIVGPVVIQASAVAEFHPPERKPWRALAAAHLRCVWIFFCPG